MNGYTVESDIVGEKVGGPAISNLPKFPDPLTHYTNQTLSSCE